MYSYISSQAKAHGFEVVKTFGNKLIVRDHYDILQQIHTIYPLHIRLSYIFWLGCRWIQRPFLGVIGSNASLRLRGNTIFITSILSLTHKYVLEINLRKRKKGK